MSRGRRPVGTMLSGTETAGTTAACHFLTCISVAPWCLDLLDAMARQDFPQRERRGRRVEGRSQLFRRLVLAEALRRGMVTPDEAAGMESARARRGRRPAGARDDRVD